MDKQGEVTALTLLDTIDHATDRLSFWYGISRQAQVWFSPYLSVFLPYTPHLSVLIYTTVFMPIILKFTCLYQFQHCLLDVWAWITGSKLKLNPRNTVFLLIGSKLQREKNLE